MLPSAQQAMAAAGPRGAGGRVAAPKGGSRLWVEGGPCSIPALWPSTQMYIRLWFTSENSYREHLLTLWLVHVWF